MHQLTRNSRISVFAQSLVFILGLCALSAANVHAQGLIIDRRPEIPFARSAELRELSVDARVRDQVAEVLVTQVIHNPTNSQLEAELLFPLPDDGAIRDFVLMVDGKEVAGRILSRDEARKIYEEIVRRRRDPALLEFAGHGMFHTSVFPIPPGADRKLTMRYTQVLRRDGDAVEMIYPLAAQRVLRRELAHFSVHVQIESADPIKSVYSPSHDIKVERSGDREARVTCEASALPVSDDFRLIYSLAPGSVGATVLSWRGEEGDGYFLLLANPEVKASDRKPLAKTVIFVLDRSGSMTGKKIEQARAALKFVLDNLNDGDLFNIVAFDTDVESFKPELQRFDHASHEAARAFIENIRAGGSTNIDSALHTALGMIQDDTRPNYVIFMTDGLPTIGERDENAIADHAHRDNARRARLFTFGVGNDVNARLLSRLSGDNAGTTEFVKPEEDIEAKVSLFYGKMSSPVLTALHLDLEGTALNRVYPRELPDLFAGNQLVVAGRYSKSGPVTLRLTGKVGDRTESVEKQVTLAGRDEGDRYRFVERVWASRRIGYLIDDIDLHGRNDELVNELIALSKRYGILTPYTAFLADENAPIAPMPGSALRDNTNARIESQLGQLSGAGGNAQRAYKGALQGNAQAWNMPELNKYNEGLTRSDQSLSSFGGGRGGRGAAPGPAGMPQEAMRQSGAKTFYNRQGNWVDSTLDDAAVKSAQHVAQFSDAYFKLVEQLPGDSAQYLAFREPVLVRLQGQVYQIDPAANVP